MIFRFVANEGPGYLGDFLDRRGLRYRLVAIDAGEPVPQSIAGAAGLVFMGGPMSVNDPLPWIAPVLDLARAGKQQQIPMLGHCLGGQLIAKAFGATVGANPVREIGWFDTTRLQTAPPGLYAELPDRFCAFHWHGETFTLPSGAIPLYRSEACSNQAFLCGTALALQFHVEMQAPMVLDWIEANPHEFVRPSPAVQDPEQMTADLGARIEALHEVADRFYSAWLGLDS